MSPQNNTPVRLEIDIPGLSDLAEAIKAVADAVAQRDRLIDKALASNNPKMIAWAESEVELRKNGNDFADDLGALPRAIAAWIASKIIEVEEPTS